MKPISNEKERTLYDETSNLRVLGVLFRYPDKEFSLSDLAKESNVAKANLGKILNEFQKQGLIEITVLTKIWRIKANRTNWNFIKLKIVYNIGLIYRSGLVEYLIGNYKNPKAIVLFGSFRKGEDISSSDIDIAIETSDNNQTKTSYIDFPILNMPRKIQIHLFSRKKVDKYLFNNIANGIVLYGFLEVKI